VPNPIVWFVLLFGLATITAPSAPQRSAAGARPSRISVKATRFVDASGRRFEWRGLTAFRLVELIAHGREKEAIAFLDWSARNTLTVVRVLSMAEGLFQLKPEEGLKALPRLLELAAARGLHVEIVALADTAAIKLDLERHTKAIATIAAANSNALVEIANEPWHPTQDPRLHDPAFVRKLADLIPRDVPVALGSVEANDGYSAGRYVTWHAPRSPADGGWGHVQELRAGADLAARFGKPVVSDEPIGAAEQFIPGRRDNDPQRFAAAAALTRLAGLGATFHYEGGLQARIPTGTELACFEAWRRALDALQELPDGGRFAQGAAKAAVVSEKGSRAVFSRVFERDVWMVLADPRGPTKITWESGWRLEKETRLDGLVVIHGRR
jgi:hypothetical protein